MRLFNIFMFFLLLNCTAFSQTASELASDNIIPNPGFEKYSSTPIGWFYKGKHYTDVMKYWSSATAASPDVFGPKVRVPSHWTAKGFGDQKAHLGESMSGITVYGCTEGKPHCREYIQIQLREPLVLNQKYYAEFWVSHLPRSLKVNGIGMYFSNEKLNINTDGPINLSPQVSTAEVISAPDHRWVKISGRFKATTEAEYLVIGNFSADSLTNFRSPGTNALNYGYYYIDDVLLKKENPILEVPIKENDLCCITVEEGKVFQLRNIYFDHDKAEFLPRSYAELNKLLKLMQENPSMIIEIRGHTDSVGEDDYNVYLSRKRAKAVVGYLNENSIDKSRTRYAGYGDSNPVANNSNTKGRQLNRRVEFLVIRK